MPLPMPAYGCCSTGFARTCAPIWASLVQSGTTSGLSFSPSTTTPSATCSNKLRQQSKAATVAEQRIAIYHGPTPPDEREAIKRAFNADPKHHPMRILIATDAVREGLNLQAHCWNLFHFDVPWNPSRMEQRNGRIDRKLQDQPEVFCHYFVYKQRPEDRILKVLVQKTERIKKELGSLAQVIDARLTETLKAGIRRDRIDKLEKEILAADLERLSEDR